MNAPARAGRASQPLIITRGQRAALVERQVEIQAAAEQAAFLVANTTPEIDSLLDCHQLERRLHAQLARAIATAKGEAAGTAVDLEGLAP